MLRHVLVGVLIGLVATSGCGAPQLVVRNERGDPAHGDSSKPFLPVEYDREDVREAVQPYAPILAALILQRGERLRLRLASTVAGGADAGEREFLQEYLSWCEVARGQRGDCLDAKDPNMPGLTADGKRAVALRMAFSGAMREVAEEIRGINPLKVEALLVVWFAFYLFTLVAPEPVTKALDVLFTASLIAFLGWDGFHNVVKGYIELRKEAEAAKDFAALHEAGARYGSRLGPSMMRIVTALVTWGIGAAAGAGRPSTELPGGDVAAWNAHAQGFELAAVTGGSVSVSASGAVTLTVASMVSQPERGGGGAPKGKPAADSQGKPCPDYPTCGAGVVFKGQDGERAVRAVADIGEKKRFFVNDRWRITDGVNSRTKVLTEIKNVRELSLTRQIRDLLDIAQRERLRFDLWVPEGADLSAPLKELIAKGAINLRYIP